MGAGTELTRASQRSATLGVAIVVCATVLFWWTAIDRLDLPKLATLVFGALGLSVWIAARRPGARLDAVSLALALAVPVSAIVFWDELAARVEGWAGFVAGLALVLTGRRCDASLLGAWLSRLAIGVACVAVLQAAGVPVLNSEISGLAGRRVVGTLGGAGHLGWTLALLLPWVGSRCSAADQTSSRVGAARWTGLVLVVAGLVLSGSRTAWVMGVVGLPLWIRGPRKRMAVAAMLCSVVLAVGLDAAARRAHLAARVADLGSGSGTAAGRAYLWSVYAHNWRELAGLGRGPEGFQRAWPAWQRSYLAVHPEQERFASDLRHAHADGVEVLSDYGLPGLGLGLIVVFMAFVGPVERSRWRDPALAGVVVAAIGGLAAPVLWFAPTLALTALCLGVRLGEVRRPVPAWSGWVLTVALVVACVPLARRGASEIQRSRATVERAMGRPHSALRFASAACELDGRNPRARIEQGLAFEAEGDLERARRAFASSLRDLPLDAVHYKLAAMGAADGAGSYRALPGAGIFDAGAPPTTSPHRSMLSP